MIKILQELNKSKTYDKEVLEVISKLFDKKAPAEILEILYSIKKDDRFIMAKNEVQAGTNIFDALKELNLISTELYDYLKSASNSKRLASFTRAYISSSKEISKIVSDLIKQTISPLLSLVAHYVVLYIAIYKVVRGIELDEKWFSALPFYFPFLSYVSKHPTFYLIYCVVTVLLIGVLFAYRKRILPSYAIYERMKLYLYLYYSIKSGKKVDESLKTFKGAFNTSKFTELLESGYELTDAIIESMTIKPTVVEKVLIKSALEGKPSELEKNIEDLYGQLLEMTKASVIKTGTTLQVMFMVLIGVVILFVYIGIQIPLMLAARTAVQ